MFTGIIQSVGRIETVVPYGDDARITVVAPGFDLASANIGDSIAVNGCCLTAVSLAAERFEADVSGETLSRTTLGNLRAGSRVNLEMALTLSTPLGGHLVSGHVDGLGEVVRRWPDGRSERWRFRAPTGLARYIAEKGSVCIDGVSLTVNAVDGAEFEVNIVPHTSQVTTLGERRPGDPVNLEVDLIARYLERLMSAGAGDTDRPESGITREFLRRNGY
jgi:riboflavin synthase